MIKPTLRKGNDLYVGVTVFMSVRKFNTQPFPFWIGWVIVMYLFLWT